MTNILDQCLHIKLLGDKTIHIILNEYKSKTEIRTNQFCFSIHAGELEIVRIESNLEWRCCCCKNKLRITVDNNIKILHLNKIRIIIKLKNMLNKC